jgi:glycosyltransferase involved in cell wall biosynthesis
MFNNKCIAVCIPAYKVQQQIQCVIQSVPAFVDYIIVIDDACPESSGKKAMQSGDKRVVVIFHDKNRGVGGAVVSGYKKAVELGAEIIVKVDGDGQMDINYLPQIINPLLTQSADYVKANRFRHLRDLRKMPKVRLFGNSFLSFLVKLTSGYWNIMDPTNGYTGISSNALEMLNLDKLSKRYFFETDILINLNIQNAVVQEVAVPARYGDEQSSMKIPKILFSFPIRLLRGLIKRIFMKYYLYDFNMASVYILVGLPMILWGAGFGLYRWLVGISRNVVNTTGTVMLSVLPLILGVQFILQAISIDISSVPRKK